MAPFVPFYGGVQVELLFVLDGKVVENRLWFWQPDYPHSSVDLLSLADGVYTWYTTYILPHLSDQLQLASVVATDWSAPGGLFEISTGPVVNGGVNAESSSANVSIVVGFRWPSQYSRLKRNKNYVPGVPEQEITLNTPTAFIQDILFEGYAALVDYARTIPPVFYWYWVVTSAILGNAPRDEMHFGKTIGPLPRPAIILGQRRKRLPVV